MDFHFRNESGGPARRHATLWLALATCSVAVSGMFAILIALARVPALGNLFPGPDFYRVALTLHVNLSQGVWFMAFAGVLWSLFRAPRTIDRLAWLAAALGATGMALSVSVGRPAPLMSNYLPVLDSPAFLSALCLFGFGVALKCLSGTAGSLRPRIASVGDVQGLALRVAAAQVVAVLILIVAAAVAIDGRLEGHSYFETLFWAGGHVWQFALLSLLMFCWLELAPGAARGIHPRKLAAVVIFGALPVGAALLVPLIHGPDTGEYFAAYTGLMRWTSWEMPLLLGILLFLRRGSRAPAPGFGLSLILFIAGLVLGAAINGQTTLVTAHYHGTIGAVTLAFMATSFVLLPRLGIEPPSQRAIRFQLGFYGYGIFLMMAGLAGAGLMGAPRKTPGDLALTWSVETVSRICLGIGGTLATVGIVMFAVLLLKRLFPIPSVAVYSR